MADEAAAAGELTAKLATGVRDRGVRLAYGEPQILNGVEFVPVAFVGYGFGATEGSDQLGSGGGGGGVAIPIGAYVGGPAGTRFQPNTIAVLAFAIPIVGALAWAVSLIIKAAR